MHTAVGVQEVLVFEKKSFDFILSDDADAVLAEERRGDAVVLCECARKRAVINFVSAAGRAARLQDGGRAAEKFSETKRFMRAFFIFRGDIRAVAAKHAAIPRDLRWNARRGETAHDLGADGDEMVRAFQFFEKCPFQRFRFSVVAAGDADEARADEYIHKKSFPKRNKRAKPAYFILR